MSESGPILAAVDMSEGSLVALDRARELSEVTDHPLVVCTVLEGEHRPAIVDVVRSHLESLAPTGEVMIRTGRPFVELIRVGREVDASLIVAGATGEHSQGQLARGVTVDRLARKADRPVLVVRRPTAGEYRSVVVGVDGSVDATQAARLARLLAPRARIIGLFASEMAGEKWLAARQFTDEELAAYRDGLQEDANRRIDSIAADIPIDDQEAVVGRPEVALIAAAEKYAADLLAVGRRGVTRITSVLLGSVGHHLVHEAPCDVLVYRSGDLAFELP